MSPVVMSTPFNPCKAPAYIAAVLADSPTGFWPLDDEAFPFLDISGGGFNLGRRQAGEQYNPGPLGVCSGSVSGSSAPSTSPLLGQNEIPAYTGEAWVNYRPRTEGYGCSRYMSQGDGGGDRNRNFSIGDYCPASPPKLRMTEYYRKPTIQGGQVLWNIGLDADLPPSYVVDNYMPSERWLHVVFTRDTNVPIREIYLDGVRIGFSTSPLTFGGNTEYPGPGQTSMVRFSVGADANTFNYDTNVYASISMASVYNYRLSQAQIDAHRAAAGF